MSIPGENFSPSGNQPENSPDQDPTRLELLSFLDNVESEEGAEYDSRWENFLQKMNEGNYWRDKEIVGRLAQKTELQPYAFCQLGMPVEVVLEDNEYYTEMLEDEFDELTLPVLCSFYETMSKTPEDLDKFRRDFAGSGNLGFEKHEILQGIIDTGECSDTELGILKAFKDSGASLLSDMYRLDFSGQHVYFDARQRREAGQRFAAPLIEHELLNGKDVAFSYEETLSNRSRYEYIGIIDAALQANIKPESDNEDVLYWSELSEHSGTNQIADFLIIDTEAEDYQANAQRLQRDFDFTKEPVMRLFANREDYATGLYTVDLFGSRKMVESLRDPTFQTIIMDTLEKRQNSRYPYEEDKEPPSLFLMLAQDRQILESMKERGVFARYPGCQKIPAIGKITEGEFAERDRLLLFTEQHRSYDYASDKYFDENGEPNDDFLYKVATDIDHRMMRVLDNESRSKADTFFAYHIETLRYEPCFLSKMDPVDYTEIFKYFNENGPKPEFWQECFKQENYQFLAAASKDRNSNIALSNIAMQFILGADKDIMSRKDILQGEGVNKDNVIAALTRFILKDADDWQGASGDDLEIREAFNGSEAKDLALEQLRGLYDKYLNGDGETEMPIELQALYKFMVENDGAGPLTQIEALLDFAGNLSSAGEQGRTYTRAIEQKMDKAHWTNQDKANFYVISAEVIQASPELYLEFAELFANIPDKKDFETFTTRIYPLYRAKLALLRNYEDHSNGIGVGFTTTNYDSVDMEALKAQLHTALLPFNLQELSPDKRQDGINRVREIIFGEISELFQEKFGLLPEAIPDNFSESDAKVIEDMTLYLGNLSKPTEQKKDIIGFFLALQLGGKNAFDLLCSGEDIDPRDYLNINSAYNVHRAIEESRTNDPFNAENTRIENHERLAAFRATLQGETPFMRLGDVQTIDLRLQNLIGNVQELTDPDLYSEKIDKERVVLLGRYPIKTIGRVAATMHQRLNGRNLEYGAGEEEIANAITQILVDNNLEVTADNIKAYFQSGLSGIKEPFNIVAKIQQEGAVQKIQELQDMLTPPDEIAQIFGRLGEEFRPQSGVIALSADLDFLENLVVKQENQLSESELSAVRGYINSIRNKMAELNTVYEKISQSFEKMKGSLHDSAPDGVKEKMHEIEKIISGSETQSVITSTCTTSMTTIIENMRACLSCKTKGINNDTNLTFGEGYRFYLYSSSSGSRNGSISDENIYFVPVGEGESQRMGFVMDQMYGTKNSDIMMSHLETVLKKARSLKSQFPEVPISIVLPNSSMSSCGVNMNAETLSSKLESADSLTISDIQNERVVVPESGFGEHYIEFGGDARTAGPRLVSGIEIIL